MPGDIVTDAYALRPGDVVEISPRAWRIIVDVSPATHPGAENNGALRVDAIGWESGRPTVLTWWAWRRPWIRVGTADGLGWVAPPNA